MGKTLPTDILFDEFLQKARALKADIEMIRVLKARTYKIAEANVLIRAASVPTGNGSYFFGLNYIHAEELANLDNPFIAFICGSIKNTIILPAQILFNHLPKISHDRNGEYKIVLDSNLNIVLKGHSNRLDCQSFINAWGLLLSPPKLLEEKSSAEESLHSVIQGRLLEIGNIRGYRTYCPNKTKKFNGRRLGDIATLDKCPPLQFSDYDILRQIDVLWFREKGRILLPLNAFEIEISTGTWPGVGRMATLIDYIDVGLYVVSDDIKKYSQVINAFYEFQSRYKHIPTGSIADLYSAELQLKELRYQIGL